LKQTNSSTCQQQQQQQQSGDDNNEEGSVGKQGRDTSVGHSSSDDASPCVSRPQQDQEQQTAAHGEAQANSYAAARDSGRLPAAALAVAALRWAELAQRALPWERDAWLLHDSLLALVQEATARVIPPCLPVSPVPAGGALGATGDCQPPKAALALSDEQAAALLHALVSADAAAPWPLLDALLQQLAVVPKQTTAAAAPSAAAAAADDDDDDDATHDDDTMWYGQRGAPIE